MNVALVELAPRSRLLRVPLWWPVYLPQLAAVLRAGGHAVEILEPWADGPESAAPERLSRALRTRPPDLVVFDAGAEGWGALRACARAARATAPSARLLAGGRYVSPWPAGILEHAPELDASLVGESERAVEALADGAPPASVAGVHVRGATAAQPSAPVPDLDALPFPAWDLLDLPYYARRTPRVIPCLPLRTATLQSARGCSGACRFCVEGRLHARPHRFHGAAYVVEAVERLAVTHGIEALYFSDESFLADRARVAGLCEALLRSPVARRLRWAAQVRADTVDAEILALMRRAGCVQLEFGVESGSDRMLAALGKGLDAARNRTALRLARAAGIRSLAYVMVGLPDETREDLACTRRFLAEARPDVVRLNPYMILPGTPLAGRLAAEGRIPPDGPGGADRALTALSGEATNVTAMPLGELRAAVRQLEREAVLARLARDFLVHNPPWALARYFRVRAVPAWIRHRRRGPGARPAPLRG